MKTKLLKKLLRMSKYAAFSFFLQAVLCTLAFSHDSEAQARNLNEIYLKINIENASLEQAFKEIERSTEFTFAYIPGDLPKKTVTVSGKKKNLEAILMSIAEQSGVSFKRIKTTIHVRKSEDNQRKVTDVAQSNLQTISISGAVTSHEDDEPLPGVNVLIKGSAVGTVTDLQGRYTLEVPGKESVIVFSFIGYTPEEIVVNDRTIIDISLTPDITSLEEVVVVAYGTQKKITTIGAQSSIKTVDLKQPVSNLSNLITGRIAGVVGVQRSGEPGYDNAQIFIRGISSFVNDASAPLVLVDGVERDFNNIDPEDIESFSIMKDASATAVYGVRGGNGVILIQTKKGQKGKPQLSFQYNQGITEFTRLPEFIDGVEYMRIANEARHNTNPELPPYYSADRIQKTIDQTDPDLYPNVNWFDEIFNKTGNNRRFNFNVNGGSEMSNYYLSVGYYDEQGMFKDENLEQYTSSIRYKRYNFTSNLSLDMTPSTKVDFGASGYISDGTYPGTSTGHIFSSAYQLPPVVHPPKYSDGKIAQQRTGDISNPYDLLTQTGYLSETRSQIWSNLRVTQQLEALVKGLSVTGMFSFDNYNSHRIDRTKSVDRWLAIDRDIEGNLIYEGNAPLYIGTNVLGYSRSNGGERQVYMETAINYVNKFGKHDVTGLLLYNQTDEINAFAGDFTGSIPFRFHGFAGRLTYAYDQRYLFEGNFGYNGSEAFAPENRYGFFPSIGIGWVASSEPFFKPLERYVQFLKVRLSHGIVGNAKLSGSGQRFAYLSTVANTGQNYVFGKTQDNQFDGLDIEYYASGVQWETAAKSNLGIELTTLQDALSVTVDIFRDLRSDIYLVRGDVPQYAGVRNAPTGNLGKIHNRGIDGTLEYSKNIGRNLNFSLRGNFTWNRATVIDDANAEWPYPWQQRIGRKLGQRFGYIAEGLFESEEDIANSAQQRGTARPGDIKFKDLNSDGVIDSYDQAPIGYGSFPEIAYGFGPSIAWKGFAIGGFFKGISNVDIMLNGEGLVPFQQGIGTRGNLLTAITDRWTQENPVSNPFYPRLSDGVNNMNYEGSTWWVRNGSYLRLQNVEVSYSFPKANWFDKVGLNSLRLYFIGYNLATFSEFKLWDVELGDGRGANYPLIKTYSFGIDCKF